MSTQYKKIVVLGVGNTVLTDEGVGVHALKELEKCDLPSNVELIDGWVAGIDLMEVIQEADKLIIIDAIDAQSEPGDIFKFEPHQVEAMIKKHNTSLHQVDLFETLKIAKFLDKYPQVVVMVGVQPKDITWGTDLTDDIRRVLPKVIEVVMQEIRAS